MKRLAWTACFLTILIGIICTLCRENTIDVFNNMSRATSKDISNDMTMKNIARQSDLISPKENMYFLRSDSLKEGVDFHNRELVSVELDPKPTLPQGAASGSGESISLNVLNQLRETQYFYGYGSFTKDMPSTSIASHREDVIPDRPIAEAIELAREASAQSIGAAGINPFSTIHK